MQVDGVPMYQLCMKLHPMKDCLKRKNLVCFGDLKQRVIQVRDRLDLTQKDVLATFGRVECMLKEREHLHAYVSITKLRRPS